LRRLGAIYNGAKVLLILWLSFIEIETVCPG